MASEYVNRPKVKRFIKKKTVAGRTVKKTVVERRRPAGARKDRKMKPMRSMRG